MKIYISGQISGQPLDAAKARFAKAAEIVEDAGCTPVNPFDSVVDDNASWEEHMVRDIEMLFGCDAILQLGGWRKSKGARIESNIAYEIGIKFCYISPNGDGYKIIIDDK